MCTVTIRSDGDGLLVTMNRDERRDREPELPPRVAPGEEGVLAAWLGPRDTRSGGTWLGVNDHGVVAGLLNNYQAADASTVPERPPSRGVIVPQALGRGGREALVAWLEEDFDPRPFRPFTIFVASGEGSHRFDWPADHERLLRTDLPRPWAVFSSSSWRGAEVLAWRAEEFEAWRTAGEAFEGDLPTFHRLSPEGMAEWAPLMARELSHTRSISQVFVPAEGDIAAIRYWPNPEFQPDREPREFRLPLASGAPGKP